MKDSHVSVVMNVESMCNINTPQLTINIILILIFIIMIMSVYEQVR
jgi:hypothetical protein